MIRVKTYDRMAGKLDKAAEFKMVGGELKATWYPEAPSFKKMIESAGVHVAAGTFYPADGQKFIDALKLAFSNSSSIFVEETGDDG